MISDFLEPSSQVVFVLSCSQHIFIITGVTGRCAETERRCFPLIMQCSVADVGTEREFFSHPFEVSKCKMSDVGYF